MAIKTDGSLTDFFPIIEAPSVNKKEALKLMRSKWLRGPVSRFDNKLGLILHTTAEKASVFREEWQSLGFLQYDEQGLLVWNDKKIQGFF